MNSFWLQNSPQPDFPSLINNINTDILIIGGGITGILTAYMLRKSNFDITIVDSNKMIMGVTCNTTAKITSQHGLLYDYLLKSFNFDIANGYLNSNQEAINTVFNIVKNENIDCDFKIQDSYVYTCDKSNVQKIINEVSSVSSLGLNSEYVTNCPLPFKIEAAIKFSNQAQFHPRKYLISILNILSNANVHIFENSKVADINYKKNHYEVLINNHIVNAKYLVMASHYPIKNFPGFYFMKMYQNSSYAIAVDTGTPIFDGMYISCDIPVTSFRHVDWNNGKLLIVGGSGHKTGKLSVTAESSYINLENYIKSIYPKSKILYKWMTEDCITLDKIPYIGNFSKLLPNMYVATGYNKWGMTTSHVAAKIISDKILGNYNQYEKVYNSERFNIFKNHKEFNNMLKQSASSLILDRLSFPKKSYTELSYNEGGIVDYCGQKVGIYKDLNGNMFGVHPYCKHLGCELSWNNLDKTWDCPCHGSRYDYHGQILNEPTKTNLDTINIISNN